MGEEVQSIVVTIASEAKEPMNKQNRHTAQAREAGLGPLAEALLSDFSLIPEVYAARFIDPHKGILTAVDALEGVKHLVSEVFLGSSVVSALRDYVWEHGLLSVTKTASATKKKKPHTQRKYAAFSAYASAIKTIPAQHAVVLFQGRHENQLQFKLTLPHEKEDLAEQMVLQVPTVNQNATRPTWVMDVARHVWKNALGSRINTEVLARLRERADNEINRVLSNQLRDMVRAPAVGAYVTMGLGPRLPMGGLSVAVVDNMGRPLEAMTVFPFAPQGEWFSTLATLAKLMARYQVVYVSMATKMRPYDLELLVDDLMKMYPDMGLTKRWVGDLGAMVYAESKQALIDCPEMDVSSRAAVSIARRLQNPKAEAQKLDLKALSATQYQDQARVLRLMSRLEQVVAESNTNASRLPTRQDVKKKPEIREAKAKPFNTTMADALMKLKRGVE